MMPELARLRRLYHHLEHSGKLRKEDISLVIQVLEKIISHTVSRSAIDVNDEDKNGSE